MLGIPGGRSWSALFWLAVVSISPPVTAPALGAGALHPLMANLLVSHYFFGGVLMLAVLLCARRSGQTKSVGDRGCRVEGLSCLAQAASAAGQAQEQ